MQAIYTGKSTAAITRMLAYSGRINWRLIDNQGLNALHISVDNNYLKYDFSFIHSECLILMFQKYFYPDRAIEYILSNMNPDLALEPMPDTQNTVLHCASIHRNFEV